MLLLFNLEIGEILPTLHDLEKVLVSIQMLKRCVDSIDRTEKASFRIFELRLPMALD